MPGLSFKEHICKMVSKANQILGIIRRTFLSLDRSIFVILYKALVRPHLEYASTVWSPRLKRERDIIERVQRRATKLVPELKEKPYTQRLRILNLPTLEFRRRRADIIQTFKVVSGIDDVETEALFTMSTFDTTRSHSKKIFKKGSRRGTRQHFFSNRIVNEWNNLPQSAVDKDTVNSFKNALEKHWKHDPRKFDYAF